MRKLMLATLCCVLFSQILFAQSGSINNTLGSGGSFVVKDVSVTFMSLSQANGSLSLNNSLTLPPTTGSMLGVIFKGADRFIHDYSYAFSDGFNTFVGVNAGNFTMNGSGVQASNNTSVGYASLTSLTTGHSNSSVGTAALTANTSGAANSAFGTYSLSSNTTGHKNSAFGDFSLLNNTSGYQNSAFGTYSLLQSTGNNNTALGDSAGFDLTTGSNNTIIGSGAQPSGAAVSNEITLGNSGITALRCQITTLTGLSDARDKKNIRDLPLGLDFLMSIKPRIFNWDRREWYENGKTDGSRIQEKPTAGFIAQELDTAQASADAEWLNLVLKTNPDRLEATPGNLLPIMVKAIQELKAQNDRLAEQNLTLRKEVEMFRSSIAEQVRKEVQTILLKAQGTDTKSSAVSLNNEHN